MKITEKVKVFAFAFSLFVIFALWGLWDSVGAKLVQQHDCQHEEETP